MNAIKASVEDIRSSGELVLVSLGVGGDSWRALMVDVASLEGLRKGASMEMLFKETEVMVASEESRLSARNSFVTKIVKITNGELLSQVEFEYFDTCVRAIITREAVDSLLLCEGAVARFFVKSNEITLRSCDG